MKRDQLVIGNTYIFEFDRGTKPRLQSHVTLTKVTGDHHNEAICHIKPLDGSAEFICYADYLHEVTK